MSSELKLTNIKHPSSGSNNLVLASDGNVSITNTLSAGTIGGGVAMASSGLTVRNIQQEAMASDVSLSNDAALTTFFSPAYTPKFSGSKVMGCLTIQLYCQAHTISDGRKQITMAFSGSDITDIEWGADETQAIGSYDYGGSGVITYYSHTIMGPLLTTSNTGAITCNCKMKNAQTATTSNWQVWANNSLNQTFFTWIEYK
jgi:hypothetical protein